jgi:peptidoglycan/LPS O-acetylase OafA/YrhL
MKAVRSEAQKQTPSPRVFMKQVTRIGPAFAGAAAACLLVVWLAFPPAPNTEAEKESPWLQFPGVVTKAAQTQYEAELARLQRDLSRSALFVRSAATPMEILGRE